jgi:ABC-type uncharacterized transport system permease subunit
MNSAAFLMSALGLVLFGFCAGVYLAEPLERWMDAN